MTVSLATASVAAAFSSADLDKLNQRFSNRWTYTMEGDTLVETSVVTGIQLADVWWLTVKDLDAKATHKGGKHRVKLQCRAPFGETTRRNCIRHPGYPDASERTLEFPRRAGANKYAKLMNAVADGERSSLVKSTKRTLNQELDEAVFLSFVNGDQCHLRLKDVRLDRKYKYQAEEVEPFYFDGGPDGDYLSIRCIDGSDCISQGTLHRSRAEIFMSEADAERASDLLETIREYCG